MASSAAFLVFLSFCSLGLHLAGRRKSKKVDLSRRLGQAAQNADPSALRQEELKQPFFRRAVQPVFYKLSGLLSRLLPSSMVDNLQPRLHRAGYPGKMTAGEYLGFKMFLAVLFATCILLLSSPGLLALATGVLLGWLLPEIYLWIKTRKRRDEIEKHLPDTLDLLTVSVEAGLGFDGAMAKVAEKSKNLLALEFARVIKESRMGKSRKEALKALAERLCNDNITTFVGAIIQADQLGISFSKVLRVQSDQIRHRRKQRIEEAAMKAPVKMLIPLVFFIFPVLFIVLLGPAAINIYTTLF